MKLASIPQDSIPELEHRLAEALRENEKLIAENRLMAAELARLRQAESLQSQRAAVPDQRAAAFDQRAAWLALLPDENPNPVARVTPEGIVQYCNPAAADPAGLAFQEGASISGTVVWPLFQRALSLQARLDEDLQASERWYTITITPYLADEYVNIHGRDITARVQAEDALERASRDLVSSHNRLLAVLEALPVGMAIVDISGGNIISNSEYEGIWGSPRPRPSSIADYDLYQAWWAETGERLRPEDWASARAVQRGETVTGQYIKIRRFDGAFGYIINSGAPFYDGEGRLLGGVVAVMDITERVQIQQALAQSEERFRVAMASAPLVVYTCDTDLRCTWASSPPPGFKAVHIIGKRDDDFLPPETAAEAAQVKRRALETGQDCSQEIKLSWDGQDGYYILTAHANKDPQGQVTGLTCSVVDVTQYHQMQMEQQENEVRVETQRRLLAYREQERQQIAHELHDGPIQMLAGVMFNIQAVKSEAVEQDPAGWVKMEQASQAIKGVIRELREMVNELRPPTVIGFGFTKTARVHAADFQGRYPHIELQMDMDEDENRLPEETCLALYRIFQESLNNARKHSHASRITVTFRLDAQAAQLQIEDNGQGFDLPTSLDYHTRGGHYGLAGMKERAEAIGGKFTVSAAPGKGTRVVVAVPVAVGE